MMEISLAETKWTMELFSETYISELKNMNVIWSIATIDVQP